MKSVGFYISRALPTGGRRQFVARACARRYRSSTLSCPVDLAHVRTMLMVLPEDTLEALYQVENVVALHEYYEQASLTFLCRSRVADYFRSIVPDAAFVEYHKEDRYLYSPAFAAFGVSFEQERFDVVFMLERQPHIALSQLIGRTGARARIGYDGGGEYPFVNYLIRPTPCEYLADLNSSMARTLGADPRRRPRLVVAKEASQGVAHLLRDMGLSEQTKMIALDGVGLAAQFGQEWVSVLISEVRKETGLTVCVPSTRRADEAVLHRLSTEGVQVVPPLTVPRTAALIARSACLVAAPSPLLRLASLLDRPAVGVQTPEEEARYHTGGKLTAGVTYEDKPDLHTVSAVVASVASLVPKPPTGSKRPAGA